MANVITRGLQKAKGFFLNPTPDPEDVEVIDAKPIPAHLKARASGLSELANLSSGADVGKIQAAIRMAERGDTLQLFTLYRDIQAGGSHIQSEFGKRKMTVVGQPEAIFPFGGKDATSDDITAAEAIKWMIANCDNWDMAMMHLLDGCMYPVAVSENIFEPTNEMRLRYRLKCIDRVPYEVLCYKLPYLGTVGSLKGGIGPNGNRIYPSPGAIPVGPATGNDATVWNPDDWEPDLRFYRVFQNGMIDFSWANIYAPDPLRHIIHRGNFLMGSMRDNFGGPMRGCLFWNLFSMLGRDWFARFMDRYGSPMPVAYVDAQQKDTLAFLTQAFAEATKIGALMVDKRAKVELQQVQVQGAADGYAKFLDFCNGEISKIILGQTLSATTKNTGLGSGIAALHSEVRDDIRQFDQKMLGETLRKTVFQRFLDFNGLRGRPPRIIWGGMSEIDQKMTADILSALGLAGLEPTDDAMGVLNERFGFTLQRKPEPVQQNATGDTKTNKPADKGD
jgi:hypothetical protein